MWSDADYDGGSSAYSDAKSWLLVSLEKARRLPATTFGPRGSPRSLQASNLARICFSAAAEARLVDNPLDIISFLYSK